MYCLAGGCMILPPITTTWNIHSIQLEDARHIRDGASLTQNPAPSGQICLEDFAGIWRRWGVEDGVHCPCPSQGCATLLQSWGRRPAHYTGRRQQAFTKDPFCNRKETWRTGRCVWRGAYGWIWLLAIVLSLRLHCAILRLCACFAMLWNIATI